MSVMRHLVIRGRVQGVGYRAFVEDAALDHGVAGWVRNRRNGDVEAVFAGPAAAVTQETRACRRGPLGAHVDNVAMRGASKEDPAPRGGTKVAAFPAVHRRAHITGPPNGKDPAPGR